MKLEETITAIDEHLPGWSWLIRSVGDDEDKTGRFLGHVMPPGFNRDVGLQSFSAWRGTAQGALEDAYIDAVTQPLPQS